MSASLNKISHFDAFYEIFPNGMELEDEKSNKNQKPLKQGGP